MIKTKKIKVGSQVYKIKCDPERLVEQGYMGLHEGNKSLISYSSDYPDPVVADTLLHETLHAIVHNYVYNIAGAGEEEIVTQMTHGLIQVMRDNPKFFDELKSML